MRKIVFILAVVFLSMDILGSQEKARSTEERARFDSRNLIHEIENTIGLIKKGAFSQTTEFIESKLRNKSALSPHEAKILEKYLADIKAVKREYTLSYAEVVEKLKAAIPDLSALDMRKWEEDDSLEYYLIDGEKKYYDNCLSDLFRVNREAAKRAKVLDDNPYDASTYPLETIASFEKGVELSRRINISFTFFEEVGGLPDATVLKAWIPYVRANVYQSDIKIVRSSVEKLTFPHKDDFVSMLYFEKVIDQKNISNAAWRSYFAKPVPSWIRPMKNPASLNDFIFVCQFVYAFDSKGFYKKVDPGDIQPYRTSSREYQKYTEETENHIWTPFLRKRSKDIVGNETNPYLRAKKIYQWICENIVWADPKPVLGDWAEYTAKYKRGDCASKANLFISLCRMNDIPARVQGGWRVEPNGGHSQHSWAQVYFESLGWLPVDADAGSALIRRSDENLRYFYFGNRTPYRMIINDDEEGNFLPAKKHPCLYGGGAQLGAFEWKDGDIEPNVKIDSYVSLNRRHRE